MRAAMRPLYVSSVATSGITKSTPKRSGSGNMTPASTSRAVSPQATSIMFMPNSPRPPMGMTSTAGAPTVVLRAVNIDSDLHLSFGHQSSAARSAVERQDHDAGASLNQLVNVPDLKDRWEGPETGRKTGETIPHRP